MSKELLTVAATLFVASCAPGDGGAGHGQRPGASIFEDRSAEVGLDFVHQGGMSGERFFLEIMGSGAALVDFDNDGDLDVFLPQGHSLSPDSGSPTEDPGDRLLRNDLTADPDGERRMQLVDVTERVGIRGNGYGQGVAVADVDNDGWADLYVTNFGPNQLWRNLGGEGSKAFEDIADVAGVEAEGWSTSAAFVDFDRDGWLDLYVATYVEYAVESDVACRVATGLPDYCSPLTYRPRRDRLFRNLGPDRKTGTVTFEEVGEASGIWSESERGLGVVSGDWNHDGWPDLYVANDMTPNFLWLNGGESRSGAAGRFTNEALLAGCAVNRHGKPEASMGVVSGDIDGDGDEDLYMTHLVSETNTLFRNDGTGLFADATTFAGLGGLSLETTGFGTAMLDFDNDGHLDLLAVNGAVTSIEAQALTGEPLPLRQPNQLFRNLGSGADPKLFFEDVSARAGESFGLLEVSRGAAVGDVDNDGDLDVLLTNNHGPARLLVNTVGDRNRWVGLRLIGTEGGRDMLGAVARLSLGDGRQMVRRVRSDGSYLSANDPRVVFGLGSSQEVRGLEVEWPDGRREAWDGEFVGRYTELQQGSGRAVEAAGG